MLGFYRFAAASPVLRVADAEYNTRRIAELYSAVAVSGAAAAVFPELSLTGASCGDLFMQSVLLDSASEGLRFLTEATAGKRTALVVGTPLPVGSRIFNAAAVLSDGRICGFVLKKYLNDFQGIPERRIFSPSGEFADTCVEFAGYEAPAGTGLVFRGGGGLCFGVEIGCDALAVQPPSSQLALSGAQVIFNISAEQERCGSAARRRRFTEQRSASLCGLYICCGAGVHESSTDGVCAGHIVAAAEGRTVAESKRFNRGDTVVFTDYNPSWSDRVRNKTPGFNDCEPYARSTVVDAGLLRESPDLDFLHIEQNPFVPEDPSLVRDMCSESFEMLCAGLAKRVEATGTKRLVVGVSGGLDSTLALLVCVWTCDRICLPRKSVCAVTMPGFGTTGRTKSNAERMAELLGAEVRTVPIGPSVLRHFSDIGHDPDKHDVVYENAQARERTQILMDIANGENAIVVGTGDLSESALGWCTFNGDHMSMYNVNCSVPKTMLRHLTAYFASLSSPDLKSVLNDVLATPVSPELLPGGSQHTENILGNYELHDFFVYYFIRYGASRAALRALAVKAFSGTPLAGKIDSALDVFMRRFSTQQFKRNVSSDGPSIGPVGLCPRGGWCAPSDYSPSLWLSD